jgi:septum formation protein
MNHSMNHSKHSLPLILASSSASRKMILNKLGCSYTAISPEIDESVLSGESVEAHVLRLSKEKALKVAEDITNSHPSSPSEALIIGCDSVCVLNGQIMSKPETHDVAVEQLRASSGKVIYFYSGLSLYNLATQNLQQKVVRTEVHFKTLSEDLIQKYLQKDQPYQCAGSIQAEGLGIILIDKMIADDPNSLVGLPLIELVKMLENESQKLI